MSMREMILKKQMKTDNSTWAGKEWTDATEYGPVLYAFKAATPARP